MVYVCVLLKNMAARQHGSGDRVQSVAFFNIYLSIFLLRAPTHTRVMVDSVMCHVRLVECTIQ